jgi:protocatechuate 3,4-dioxygenase beta subunit
VKPAPDVLERNLRLLLRRSYVPALPAPHFRDRLESLFLAEVERRSARGARRVPGPRSLAGPLRVALALAAGLLLVLFASRRLRGGAMAARERLLARGEIALGLPDGSWRAADAREREHGVRFAPPALVAVTPEGAELDLVLEAGRLHLGERTEVEVVLDGEGPAATLRAGSAWFEGADARPSALVPLVRQPLEATPPASAEPLASRAPPATREALAPSLASAAPAPPIAAARVLTGAVIAAADGRPLSDFTLGLLRERRSTETHPPVVRAFTDVGGTFRWPDPPAGKQRVFVHAPGYALCALGEHDLSVELPELTAALAPGAAVRGSVLDAQGNPVPGALVLSEHDSPTDGLFLAGSEGSFWLPVQTRSGPDGRFELAHLTRGVHTLRVSVAGFATAWRSGVRAPLPADEELVIRLGPGGTIEGRVLREDGGPWAETEVEAVVMDPGDRPRMNFAFTLTDADGRYRFEHLPAETMIVVTMRADPLTGVERPDVRPVQVVSGETVTADFGSPEHGIRLHGRVLRGDGKPLAFQNLGLFDRQKANWGQDWVASTTHADGAYVFEGVAPGRYQMYLIDELGRGLRCVSSLELAPGRQDVEHELRLPAGKLEVSVHAAESAEPLAQAALTVMRNEGSGDASFFAFGLTDAHGRCGFSDLAAGTYTVYAYPAQPGLGFARSEPLSLSEDHPVALEIGLEPGGAVDVLVRTSEGRALEGALVLFRDESGDEHAFSRARLTDAAGRYRAQGLRPGRYRVEVEKAGFQDTPVEFRYELGRELEVPVVLAPIPPR